MVVLSCESHGLEHISVFAAAGFLGLLRQSTGDLDGRGNLREPQLAQLRPHRLFGHLQSASAMKSPFRQCPVERERIQRHHHVE